MSTDVDTNWQLVKTNSSLEFHIRNAGFLVKGHFQEWEVSTQFDPNHPTESQFEVTVKSKSINTRNSLRDGHLTMSDYFHVSKYPTIQFQSQSIQNQGKKFSLTGKLRIKATEKEITIPFQIEEKPKGILLKGNFSLDRLDYQIGGKSFILGDEVKIWIQCLLRPLS